MKTYCLVCKKLTDNTNLKTVKNKGRLMIWDLNSQGSGLLDSLGLNTPQSRIKNALCNAFR